MTMDVILSDREKDYLKSNSKMAEMKIPKTIVEIDMEWVVKLCKDENFDGEYSVGPDKRKGLV